MSGATYIGVNLGRRLGVQYEQLHQAPSEERLLRARHRHGLNEDYVFIIRMTNSLTLYASISTSWVANAID